MAHIEKTQSERYVLLVEGQDDQHVVYHICDRRPELPDFFIREMKGIDSLLESVQAMLKTPRLQALGILIDANSDPTARWNQVKCSLPQEGLKLPKNIPPGGLVIDTPDRPRVGVWMMPDNVSSGELEDFVAKMIPGHDPIWRRAKQYIDQIPDEERKFKENKELSAKVYAWLATRKEPKKMGLAIKAGGLDISNQLCQSFVKWLAKLFAKSTTSPAAARPALGLYDTEQVHGLPPEKR